MVRVNWSTQAAIAAGGTTTWAAVHSWPENATTIMAVVGVVVTGGLAALAAVDRWRMARKKEWDEVNKESLSAQLARSLENQDHMRESLHRINGAANAMNLRNDELQKRIEDVTRRLYDTDVKLNETNGRLREALDKLSESTQDRQSLRDRIARLESTSNPTWQAQAEAAEGRLDRLENPATT